MAIFNLFHGKDHDATLINTISAALRHRNQCRRETDMPNNPHSSPHPTYPWRTKTFAARNHIEQQTARKRYSQTGSYFGVVPEKRANGRLAWPNVIATKLGAIAVDETIFSDKGGTK
ncbi:hypothetical protein JVX96_00430 [Variovorax sp. PDNC026]|uniref:hypothetical protein n=1 Tax=Variovorax sp. PDNC026 TaxID=2811425 RepID=UPI00196267B4|nr:hypothetical protein [Variovorax sp. PDNC026]QRY31831.1 hypothetical protein JVX96_00430 [Variovorax sp. PDNC026]